VEFLGHILGGDGISTMEEKVLAIRNLQLSLEAILTPPDPNFILDMNPSNVNMGGVLAQVGPEGEKVVVYFSKQSAATASHAECFVPW